MSASGDPTRLAKELFLEALELPEQEWARFVEQRCGPDVSLATRLRSLLRAHERAERVLPAHTPVELGRGGSSAGEPDVGDSIGPYRVVRLVGRGGFGVVFLAEQTEPVRRRVAVKVVKAGMDTAEVLSRFENERRALAVMDHPGIARVLDAGATDAGRPYFAMEYVDGPPITEFAQREQLGLEDRLRLFRTACDAVQHAHSKGVLHRDLKPSNVLVAAGDDGPLAKVIDFGIARAVEGDLAEGTRHTRQGELVGTPACMSPEQIGGSLDVDTRSDVYALGALLYELLTGRPPLELDGLGWGEVLRRIAEDEPVRPSRVALGDTAHRVPAECPEELDWICLRALEKDRERRYPTARALGDDVRRFLEHEPLEAAPPSRLYRMRKLARRHRTASLAGAATLGALLLGSVGLAVGLVRAREAEGLAHRRGEEAARQARIAEGVNAFLIQDVMEPLAPSAQPGRGRDVSLREAFDVAVAKLAGAEDPGGRFAGEPLVVAAIRETAGTVYGQLGEGAEAIRLLEAALDVQQAELGPEDPVTLSTRSQLAGVLRVEGRYEEARELLERTLAAQVAVHGPAHGETQATRRRLSFVLQHQLEYQTARDLLEEARALALAEHGPDSENLLSVDGQLAIVCGRMGDYERAEELFRSALERQRERRGPDDPDTLAVQSNLASFLLQRARYDEAVPLLERSVDSLSGVSGPFHPDTLRVQVNLCEALGRLARVPEALERLEPAYAGALEEHGPEHPDVLLVAGYLARLRQAAGDIESAERLLRDSIASADAAFGADDSTSLDLRKDLVGILFRTDPHGEEVETVLRTVHEYERETLGPDHPTTIAGLNNIARLMRLQERYADAEEAFRECVELASGRFGDEDPYSIDMLYDLANFLNQQARLVESEPFARRGLEASLNAMPDGHPLQARGHQLLGVSLLGQERFEEAEPVLLEAWDRARDIGVSMDDVAYGTAVNLTILYERTGREDEAMRWHGRMAEATQPPPR